VRLGRLGIALTGVCVLALLAAPPSADAEPSRVYRVGVVYYGGPHLPSVEGLREGLRELGWEEGKHCTLVVRDTKGDPKAVETAARELERDNVDLIYSIHGQGVDLTAKRLELLKEIVPRLRRIVTLYNPDNPSSSQSVRNARDAGRRLKVDLVERQISSVEELRAGLHALRPGEVDDAFFYVAGALVTSQTDVIIEATRSKKLPTMFSESGSVTRGALAAYGISYRAAGRLSAKQVQRVLEGTAAGELPVEQPVGQLSKPHLALNLKTAKTIGLTIPPSVLTRADEVIQ
jgi:ABC-type uncharacterized transport system substrate-binding protein